MTSEPSFNPSDIVLDSDVLPETPTRDVPVKWVIVVNRNLAPGLIANATACMAAAVGRAIPRILGEPGADANGSRHEGLPWLGCSILGADADGVRAVRTRARQRIGIHVAEMADLAQKSRVYQDYLDTLSATTTDELVYYAVSLVGPRRSIDKLVGKLSLLH